MKTFDKILNMGQSRVGGTRQLASQRKSSSGMSSSLNYKEDNDKFIFNSQIFFFEKRKYFIGFLHYL